MAYNDKVLLSSLLVGYSGYTAGRGSDPGLHKASLIVFRVPDEGVTLPGTGSFSWQKHKRPSHTLQAQIRPLLTCDVSGGWSFCWAKHQAQPDLVGWASPLPGNQQCTDAAR